MVLGIDIGGTNIKFGLVDDAYTIFFRDSIPTNCEHGAQGIVRSIIQKAQEIYNICPFGAIGIGTPGTIDMEKGICICASNLPYQNTPIVDMIQTKFHMPITIANDATAAVCGELYGGEGKQCDNFIILTLGTGVGGGIVINRKPYYGAYGGAGEFGHFTLKYDGLSCPCGQNGCFEQYASVTALIKQTAEAVKQNPGSQLARMSQQQITGKTVFDAMRSGCEIAMAVIENYTSYIAFGITSLAYILQPEKVILGGAISQEGDFLIKPIRRKVTLPTTIISSPLGNDAGILGAAAMVKEGYK